MITLEFLITYLVYILALVAVVFLMLFFHARLEVLRLRKKTLIDLVESGYDINKLDFKELFKL